MYQVLYGARFSDRRQIELYNISNDFMVRRPGLVLHTATLYTGLALSTSLLTGTAWPFLSETYHIGANPTTLLLAALLGRGLYSMQQAHQKLTSQIAQIILI